MNSQLKELIEDCLRQIGNINENLEEAIAIAIDENEQEINDELLEFRDLLETYSDSIYFYLNNDEN